MTTCIWLTFNDTGCGTRALLDTGAGISLIPRSIYELMTSRPSLNDTDKIEGAKASSIECVALISSITLRPGQEIQTVAAVEGGTVSDDITCIVQPAVSLFARPELKLCAY